MADDEETRIADLENRIGWLTAQNKMLKENPRDEYHTMHELYEYRMLYNALAANSNAEFSMKSKRHHDGELCFGGKYFIVVMYLSIDGVEKQVSNHYKMRDWDYFKIRQLPRAPLWDGHTPALAAVRLRQFLSQEDELEA